MSRVIVIGVGSAAKDFLSLVPDSVEIVAFMDNDASKHGSFIEGHQVLSPDNLPKIAFDYIVIAARAVDEIRENLVLRGVPTEKIIAYYPSFSKSLHESVNRDVRMLNGQLGLAIPPVGLATMYLDLADTRESADQPPRDFVRDQAFRLAARRVSELNVAGAIGELGVYQGDQARLLNSLFPDRLLYLFDTFTGFSENDLSAEEVRKFSAAALGDFSNTSTELVMSKMPHPANVRICQGYFPDSALHIEQDFAFVSLDVDLYEPTLAGLGSMTG